MQQETSVEAGSVAEDVRPKQWDEQSEQRGGPSEFRDKQSEQRGEQQSEWREDQELEERGEEMAEAVKEVAEPPAEGPADDSAGESRPEGLQGEPADGAAKGSAGKPRTAGDDDGSGSEDDEPSCRICRQGEEAGKLYCPCRCAGSIKWIHESCLKSWLQAQDRRPICELCGYAFEYTRVYSEHAPHRLTVADWISAFSTSACAVCQRAFRIAYATLVWGIALPLLTVNSAHTLYGRGRGLSPSELRHVLPFTLNVFLGECLSLAGIAVIYLNSLVPGLLAAVSPHSPFPPPSSAAEGAAAAAGVAAAAATAAAAAAEGLAVPEDLGAAAPPATQAAATAGEPDAGAGSAEPRGEGGEAAEGEGTVQESSGAAVVAPQPRPDGETATPVDAGVATAEPGAGEGAPPPQGPDSQPPPLPPPAELAAALAPPPPGPASQFGPRPPTAGGEEEIPDPEEDLWNIMGLQGNPLRALGCMVTFLGANVIGMGLFLAVPFYIGRATLAWLLPLVETGPSGGASLAMIFKLASRFLGLEPPPGDDVVAVVGMELAGVASAGPSAPDPAPVPLTAEGLLLVEAWNATDFSSVAEFVRSRELPLPGQSAVLDIGALTVGYLSVAVLLMALIPGGLLLGAALGCSSRGPEVVRAFTAMALEQARQAAVSTWLKLQMLSILLLQLVLVPCYIGHLVVCLLCGPVLHLPQETRAAMANGNLPLTLVMQLFIGYVHLWGIAFLEGCVADIVMPAVLRSASSNFFIGALCSHRRLFGTGTVSNGSADWPLLLPVSHLTALKLALVHVAFHTPLAYVLWHLPARMLDRLLGEMLFPVHLVDHTVGPGGILGGNRLPRRELRSMPGSSAASGVEPGHAQGQPGDSQPFFAIEMLQLYILVLQCLRVLDASPGLSRLIAMGLRGTFRCLGLQHLLADPPSTSGASGQPDPGLQQLTAPVPPGFRVLDDLGHEAPAFAAPVAPPERTAEAEAEVVSPSPAPARWRPLLLLWQLLVVGSLLVVVSWTGMVLMLSLPLTVGRTLVRYALATQARRVSDFLPLSLGVVVFSAAILAVVKISEALPAISARASRLEQRRFMHLLLCAISSGAMAIAVLVLIPLGLGTLLLRLVLPLKAHSVYQVPIVFLVTDCWSLGLVLTKVVWRLVQTDVVLHSLHLEFAAAWSDVQGSFTNLFFDLRAHQRIWRRLIMPLLEGITLHFLLPRTVALTLLRFFLPEDQEYLRSALLMYCYHFVLAVRVWFVVFPLMQGWVTDVRQRIFDAKYLVSTELQNYHRVDADQNQASAL